MEGNQKFSMVLPVLFYEYLALSITRSILPGMLVDAFGKSTYVMVGIIETVKGLLAFFSCPLFGKISDKIGRKYCLLITVAGTTFPLCVLAFTSNMWIYACENHHSFSFDPYLGCVALSGLFSATFPLTFAYIADCVKPNERAPAYGLALATLGLSFTIGPPLGGYIDSNFSSQAVFILSFVLVILDILYIIFILPETISNQDNISFKKKLTSVLGYLPSTLSVGNIADTFRIFRGDPFMKNIACIVFLYYTAVWAIVSTLMVYVTRRLHFSPLTVGWLLSFYGVATMFSEGVLVRWIVPALGEINSMRLGLFSFSCQAILLAFSASPKWIYLSVTFSMLSNLVYPSISSLVSKIVVESEQGEAQGALNGIKAITEGFGPLFFGSMMALFEGGSLLPGAPYLLAAIGALWALLHSFELPIPPEIVAPAFEFPSIKYKISSREDTRLLEEIDSDEEILEKGNSTSTRL